MHFFPEPMMIVMTMSTISTAMSLNCEVHMCANQYHCARVSNWRQTRTFMFVHHIIQLSLRALELNMAALACSCSVCAVYKQCRRREIIIETRWIGISIFFIEKSIEDELTLSCNIQPQPHTLISNKSNLICPPCPRVSRFGPGLW